MEGAEPLPRRSSAVLPKLTTALPLITKRAQHPKNTQKDFFDKLPPGVSPAFSLKRSVLCPSPTSQNPTPAGKTSKPGRPFRRCGSCCRGRRDLLLSGYDLYRLAVRLDLPPEVVAEGFCDRYTGPDTGFPALRVRPRKDTGSCPFLIDSRCTVHDARPLACALYPLGQTIALPEGTASYFMQDVRCGKRMSGQTLARLLMGSGIAEREPIDIRWAEVCIECGWRAAPLPRSS